MKPPYCASIRPLSPSVFGSDAHRKKLTAFSSWSQGVSPLGGNILQAQSDTGRPGPGCQQHHRLEACGIGYQPYVWNSLLRKKLKTGTKSSATASRTNPLETNELTLVLYITNAKSRSHDVPHAGDAGTFVSTITDRATWRRARQRTENLTFKKARSHGYLDSVPACVRCASTPRSSSFRNGRRVGACRASRPLYATIGGRPPRQALQRVGETGSC